MAVGVSGGKDSLTLLAALAKLREFYPKPFTVEAITLDMGHADGRESADFSRVADLCARLNVPYTLLHTEIPVSYTHLDVYKRQSLRCG